MEKTNNHHLKPRSRRKTNMYDTLKERIRKKFVLEPTEEDIQFLLFNTVFFTYFTLMDGYPDDRNDILIKSQIITDNPSGWDNVMKEMGFYYEDGGDIHFMEGQFLEHLDYHVLKNGYAHIERTQWANKLLNALVNNIPINIDDIVI